MVSLHHFIACQAQQALVWGVMRLFWCYGSERFWNLCGHMITDRARPLTNFVRAYNMQRSVDNVPPGWIDEVVGYATQHKLRKIRKAADYLRAEPPEPEYGVRALFQRSLRNGAAGPALDPRLLEYVLPQLAPAWSRGDFDTGPNHFCCDMC